MTTLPNDDFNRRLTQIVPYPGFVVSYSRLEDELKPPSLSPIGPTHSNIEQVAGEAPNGGIVRVHSDGVIPSRRVMWDLLCRHWFPSASIHEGRTAAAAGVCIIVAESAIFNQEVPTTIHRKRHRNGRDDRASAGYARTTTIATTAFESRISKRRHRCSAAGFA